MPRIGSVTVFCRGDRVILTSPRHGEGPSNPVWNGKLGQVIGKVDSVHRDNVSVVWNNGHQNSYAHSDLSYHEQDKLIMKRIKVKGKTGTVVCKLRDFYIVNFKEDMKGFSCDGKYRKGSCLIISKSEAKEINK